MSPRRRPEQDEMFDNRQSYDPEACRPRAPAAALVPPRAPFDGVTIQQDNEDPERLHRQLTAVLNLMRDGQYRTLAEIHAAVGGSEAGVSARLRDLRKGKFGAHEVQRRHRKKRLFEYRVLIHKDALL